MPNLQFTFSLITAAALFCGTQAVGESQGGETIGDRIWIWGHPAGVYNESYLAKLPKKSTLEPVAAADYMGVRNMIFVRYSGKPAPPFDTYYVPFQKLDHVYWSLVGASGVTSTDEREHVFRLAETHENIVGFILDDFFHSNATGPSSDPETEAGDLPPFEASLTPQELHALSQRQVRGRKLPIMAVVYTGQISRRARAHVAEVDQVCMWTWRPADLTDLEGNLARLEKLVGDKPIYLGCYMYDFADSRPLPVELMQRQTELGYQWLKQGRIQGMIFLATPNVDVDLEAVAWTRNWIAQVSAVASRLRIRYAHPPPPKRKAPIKQPKGGGEPIASDERLRARPAPDIHPRGFRYLA